MNSHRLVGSGEANEVHTGKRAADLLHAAPGSEVAEIDDEEARVLEPSLTPLGNSRRRSSSTPTGSRSSTRLASPPCSVPALRLAWPAWAFESASGRPHCGEQSMLPASSTCSLTSDNAADAEPLSGSPSRSP
jgi:hypothetical protein